jgi:hypothetical protein
MNPRHLLLGLLLSLSSLVTQAAPPDVSGTWKWNFERADQVQEISMKLKQEGSKVTGAITGPEGREVEVREGKISEQGNLTFHIEFERDGNALKINFDGKAAGDAITGKTKFVTSSGEPREWDWLAKRDKRRDLSGNWTSLFKRQDGTTMETTLNLKQEGERLTGKNVSQFGETDIQEGKVQGNDVSFRIVRERDGRSVTAKYRGKIQEDNSIKGQVESDWSGEVRRSDWEAKKK